MQRLFFYSVVFVLGILSMGFQLLGSRLLSPHFGSSLIVWAWLISTFLAAFSTGSMLGGWISSAEPARRAKLQFIAAVLGVAGLAFTALLGKPTLDQLEVAVTNVSTGLLIACILLFFIPVTMLSAFGPLSVRYEAALGRNPGAASGLIYGISTVGNIAGVMLTAFVLIPNFRVSHLLHGWLAVAILGLSCLLWILRPIKSASPVSS